MQGPILDPVTGFRIPASWLRLCADPEAPEKIRSGRFVLLSSGKLLKRGLTTGTTAAAACKGAILSLWQPASFVEVSTPAGLRISLPVVAKEGFSVAVKDSGDHQFDVTRGLEMVAQASPSEDIVLIPGKGIGRIAAPGLCDEVGRPAISPNARRQIMSAIEEGLLETGLPGARVELCIPRGEELARETLNPHLGILGGISILGTTGFVEPWNDHLADDRAQEMESAKKVVITTGRTGLKFSRILFPDHYAVLMGSHLDRLTLKEGQESILCGLPALILKWAWPGILEGTGYHTVAEMATKEPDHKNIDLAVEKAKARLPFTRIVLLHKDGSILRDKA
ncbi:Cobalt-precorrin-5B C(1)-methyltransferase [uncultured archaeon]|nr:Cobalt-precorrin-5B C(1)-methyltransferase [uncultured archaeon]